MEQDQLLEEFLRVLGNMSIVIKYDRGNFHSGFYRYREQNCLYLNRKSDTETKLKTIIEGLSDDAFSEMQENTELKRLIDEAEKSNIIKK